MTKNFYDTWLDTPNRLQDQLQQCQAVARDADIPWVSTPQDVRVKLMVANELGFTTMGSNVLKAEIPVGWHTGKHRHGEESMHILEGEGFSIIDGQRFDWHKSSTIQIPFWAEHQHFNTSNIPVLYISGMSFDLEAFLRVARIQQIETCGPNDPSMIAAVPPEVSQYYPNGDRATIHIEQAPSNKDLGPEGKIRGEINVLLCGDPGTSKSQMLSFVHRIAPRGMYTSGTGSSAAGLTAYITRDPDNKHEFMLESGALVLSDRGVCE